LILLIIHDAGRPGAHPRFETVQAALRALGVKLTVTAHAPAGEERKKTDDVAAEARRLTKGLAETMEEVVETLEALAEPEKGRGREVTETAGKAGPRLQRWRRGATHRA
jgi:hypothetical protein